MIELDSFNELFCNQRILLDIDDRTESSKQFRDSWILVNACNYLFEMTFVFKLLDLHPFPIFLSLFKNLIG